MKYRIKEEIKESSNGIERAYIPQYKWLFLWISLRSDSIFDFSSKATYWDIRFAQERIDREEKRRIKKSIKIHHYEPKI